jgi:hypothetical protein
VAAAAEAAVATVAAAAVAAAVSIILPSIFCKSFSESEEMVKEKQHRQIFRS